MPPRPFRHPHHAIPGFTLIEMLIAMVILCLVLGIALPGFTRAVARVKSVSARSAITATLFDAQRHATVLGRQMVVCPGNETGCGIGSDWSGGWIVFIDDNGDRRQGPGETIVRREPALPAGVGLRSTVGRPRIVYQPNGGSAGSNATFTLCDRRGPDDAQRLVLANGGRLRTDRAEPAAAAACVAGL